jgi:hypothetical protein
LKVAVIEYAPAAGRMVPAVTELITPVFDCAKYVIAPGTLFATCALSTPEGTAVPKVVEFALGDQLNLVAIMAFDPGSVIDGAVESRFALSPE